MRPCSICFIILGFVLSAFAAPLPVAEYCAEILTDSTYRPLLVKDLNEPIKEWNYPKKIHCGRAPCEAEWVTKVKLDFPYDLVCKKDFPTGLFCPDDYPDPDFLIGHDSPMELKRVKNVKLNGSRILGVNSCERKQWILHNARESLKKFYGMTFRAEWIGVWDTQDNGHLPPMKRDFLAKLVGECADTIPSIEYCVAGGKNAELYLTDSLDNFPQSVFANINDNFPQSVFVGIKNKDTTMDCEGMMRVEKSYEMDFGKYGKRMLSHFVEEDTCHGTSVIAKKVYMPVPKYVSAKSLKGIPAKNLYGKNIPVMLKNVLNCNFDTIERNVRTTARIVGKCDKRSLQKKKKLDLFELMQVKDVSAYGHSLVGGWIDDEDGHAHPSECVEVKDLLK